MVGAATRLSKEPDHLSQPMLLSKDSTNHT